MEREKNNTNLDFIETEDIEEIKNEYFNLNYIVPQPERLFRVDSPSGRVYSTIDTEKKISIYPSVTSIISRYHPTSPYLVKWWCDLGYDEAKRRFKEAGQYGTFQHIIFNDIVKGQDVDITQAGLYSRILKFCEFENISERDINIEEWIKKSKQDTLGIIQWMQDYEVEPIAVELTLYSTELQYAGTLDLICLARLNKNEDKELILVDYKTGRNDFYDDNIIQLEAYKLLWNHVNLKSYIGRIFNLGAKDYRMPLGKNVQPYRFQEHTESQHSLKWNAYYSMYKQEQESFYPQKKSKVIDGVVNKSTKITDMIGEEDPLEFLQNLDLEKESETDKYFPFLEGQNVQN